MFSSRGGVAVVGIVFLVFFSDSRDTILLPGYAYLKTNRNNSQEAPEGQRR